MRDNHSQCYNTFDLMALAEDRRSLSTEQKAEMQQHISECAPCRGKYIYWQGQMSMPSEGMDVKESVKNGIEALDLLIATRLHQLFHSEYWEGQMQWLKEEMKKEIEELHLQEMLIQTQEINVGCEYWQTDRFMKYWLNELEASGKRDMELHWAKCEQCSARASLYRKFVLEITGATREQQEKLEQRLMEQLGIYLSRTQTEIHQQVIAEMDNGLYLLELGIERQAEELNKQIEQVVRQEIKKELQGRIQETAEKETAIQWQGVWLIGEQKRTGRGSWQAKAAMAVIGVILLMAGLQLYSSYHASKRNKDNGIKVEDVVIDLAADSRLRPIASAELPAEMKEWLEAGEVAEQQIEAGNKQALLVRAKAFEQLLLLEDAKQDYEQYLKEYPNDREISKQLRQLDRKLAKQVAPPLSPYQKLQVAIDEYLTASRTSNGEAVNKASSEMAEIAEEIKAKGDSLGIDLVSYYRSVSIEQLEPLQQARNLRREVEFGDATDRLDELTLKAEQAKKVFEQLEARLEVELTNVELIRCLNRKRQMQMVEPLLNTGIRYAIDNHYIFLHSRFLTLQGELYSNLGNYSATITTFESAINVATPLGTPELFLRPSLWLAMINTTINNNILTFQQAYNTVLLARGLDRPIYEIQPITLLGISANVLKYSSIAERYFQRAIKLANRQNNYSYSALAHAYLGLVRVEQKRFQEAENEFFQAHITSNKLTDIGAQTYARFLVTAYQARAMKLMGKLDYAIELYQTALSLAEKANIFKELILSLILSQLHQGLGECYMEKRNRDAAETEMVASLQLADEAKKKFQTGNPFLTFATTTKTSREQLEFIRCCFKE